MQGIRLAKVESAAQVDTAYGQSRRFDDRPHLVPLIESALGLRHAAEIAGAIGVHSITLGESDLRADLGLPRGGGDEGLLLARLTVVQASRAAGLPSPVASVHPNVSDVEGLRGPAGAAQLGFFGRSVIHPRQVAVVRAAFAPTRRRAASGPPVLGGRARWRHAGAAAATLADGSFVDPAILRRPSSIRERARA